MDKERQYIEQTKNIIKKVLTSTSNAIDVGAHKGKFLDNIIEIAPKGFHYAFEPLPDMFNNLKEKYSRLNNIKLINKPLYNEIKRINFKYIVDDPGFSGIEYRSYPVEKPRIREIPMTTTTLDSVIGQDFKVDLIKVDTEGADYFVIDGGKNLIAKHKPVIIFEFGLGGTDYYGIHSEQMFELLNTLGMRVYLLPDFLADSAPLSSKDFNKHYYDGLDYTYVAA